MVSNLPAGTSIQKGTASTCNDGSVIPNVPTTTTTTAATGTSTYTLDGRYHVGMLNSMRPQLTQVFAETLGVNPSKVSLAITRSVLQILRIIPHNSALQISKIDYFPMLEPRTK